MKKSRAQIREFFRGWLCYRNPETGEFYNVDVDRLTDKELDYEYYQFQSDTAGERSYMSGSI